MQSVQSMCSSQGLQPVCSCQGLQSLQPMRSCEGVQSLQSLFCSQTVISTAATKLVEPPVIYMAGGFFGSRQIEAFALDRDWGVPVPQITVL